MPASAPAWLLAAAVMVVLVLQVPAVFVLLSRLLSGPGRRQPLTPQRATVNELGAVSIVVPTLNEFERIAPCLAGLSAQGYEVREILIVDSHSTDGTDDLVRQAQHQDPRFRLLHDDPLPQGWVGRPWALHTGFLHSAPQSRWVLGIDADTQPQPGLVAALVQAAESEGWDLVSLAPQFILKTPGELLLQPSLLITLVYRFGPAGGSVAASERVMANGQCFLCRREVLEKLGGYTAARQSFCDDVTLARYAAQAGAKVGFWDGANLLKVRMYEGLQETWQEWGRSLDLKDAASSGQVLWDLWFLVVVQALPWLLTPLLAGLLLLMTELTWPVLTLWGVNSGLLLIRFGLQGAIAPSYDLQSARHRWLFWLSPLTDLAAVVRIALSSMQTPTQWRGRQYGSVSPSAK